MSWNDYGLPPTVFTSKAEAEQFVINRLRKLLTGDVGRVIGGFKQMLSKKKHPSIIRYELEKVIGYMERNREHMRYDICLELGYPIGSGAVEGACRNLINDRMELTGMKWSRNGAEATIRLRSVDINGDWEDFWEFYRKKERNRLYPSNPPNLSRNIRRRIETGSVKLSDRK